MYSPTISEITGANVYLKLETLQKAGSFKVRGATNKILSHIDTIREQGVIAASAGNHAQGVAVAAHSAGIPATIVMPEWSSTLKAGSDQRVWGTGDNSWPDFRGEYHEGTGDRISRAALYPPVR